jgi:hypothetical protein
LLSIDCQASADACYSWYHQCSFHQIVSSRWACQSAARTGMARNSPIYARV